MTDEFSHQYYILPSNEVDPFWYICITILDIDALIRVLEDEVAVLIKGTQYSKKLSIVSKHEHHLFVNAIDQCTACSECRI